MGHHKPTVAEVIAKKLKISYEEARELEYRRMGRSTAIALSRLAAAMQTPGFWVELKDHEDRHMCHLNLMKLTMELCNRAQLVGFEFVKKHKFGHNERPAVRFCVEKLQEKLFGFTLE